MKDAGLRVRVEKELREEFVGTCRLQGRHAADVLRDFMRDYVTRERGGLQQSLFSNSRAHAAQPEKVK
jgi:hypothetical protein